MTTGRRRKRLYGFMTALTEMPKSGRAVAMAPRRPINFWLCNASSHPNGT
jgi:hypothetical protein